MKKLNNEQMENLQGGLFPIDLCQIGQNMAAHGMYTFNMELYVAGLNFQGRFCA